MDLHAEADREYGPCDEHRAQMRSVTVYPHADRPDVLVEADGQWHQGELRQWLQDPDDGWWGQVQWRTAPGAGTHIDTFPADRITEDHSTDGKPLPLV